MIASRFGSNANAKRQTPSAASNRISFIVFDPRRPYQSPVESVAFAPEKRMKFGIGQPRKSLKPTRGAIPRSNPG